MGQQSETFIVKLPLITETWQEHIINKRFEYCREIYNAYRSKIIRILHYHQNTNEWKSFNTLTKFSERNKLIGQYIKEHDLPLTEYGLTNQCKVFAYKYKKYGINSTITEFVLKNLWSSVNKYLYGKGKKIVYKEKDTFNSYRIRKKSGFNGITYDLSKSTLSININGKKGKDEKTLDLKFFINPKSTYETEAFSPSNELREIGIQREFIRGKWKYYVSFTIKGIKPNKGRQLGEGNVGIDLGPSTIAVSSDNKVYIDELAKDVESIEKEIAVIQQKMDRSRRLTNPLQFNEDGQIRRYQKGERPAWIKSNNYIKLQNKLKELYRRRSAKLKLSHINLANEIIGYGNNFTIEKNPISSWALRAKETKYNRNGRCKKKKRFGKSIGNHAPSMFGVILENKINSLGGKFTKMDIKHGASQFDFTNQTKTKHELNERRITLSNGKTHLRDLISAFNIQHHQNGEYNVELMKSNYDNFCKFEKNEIERHQNSGKKLVKSFGI